MAGRQQGLRSYRSKRPGFFPAFFFSRTNEILGRVLRASMRILSRVLVVWRLSNDEKAKNAGRSFRRGRVFQKN